MGSAAVPGRKIVRQGREILRKESDREELRIFSLVPLAECGEPKFRKLNRPSACAAPFRVHCRWAEEIG